MITLLIVDDHKLIREGLRSLLASHTDISVIGEADNGRSAVELAGQLSPDVVLMDVTMPVMNGIDATRLIAEESPRVRVLIVSMHKDKGFLTKAFRAGAKGYLLKDCAPAQLLQAIRSVAAGETYVCPEMMELVVEVYKEGGQPAAKPQAELTAREQEVLQLVAEGKSAKEIAFLLKINVKTVDTHRRQIMKKLNIFSVAELTKYAIRRGVTTVNEH